MKKSKTQLLLILLTALVTLPICAQIVDESQGKQNSGYGIESEESYGGSSVLEMIEELMTAAEAEIESAATEAYAEGYKQGLLASLPDAEYWERRYEFLKSDTDTQIKKLKRERWYFALGGFGAGFLGGGITGFSVRLQF